MKERRLKKRHSCKLHHIMRHASCVLVVGWLPTLLSCATPTVFGPDHLGIGIYTVDRRTVSSDVTYRHIEGIGAIMIDRRLSLGYIDHQSIWAKVEGRSYTARTPLVTFSVGQEAARAGTEFVFPNSLSIERSK
ncbi:MAG: hypothetical protein JSW66_09830 [Phycisphaerales bacterium]|nr:MAG: hypothetical protein JSW66_09830 [Phycisphaerales bacterium]